MREKKILSICTILFFALICVQCEKKKSATQNTFQVAVDSLNAEAFKFMIQKEWELSFKTTKRADSLATHINYAKGRGKSFRIQSYYWNQKGRLDSAFSILQHAEDIEKKAMHYKGLLAVYNTKALLYKRNELYEDALEVYKKALTIQDSSITNAQRSNTHVNLGNVYVKKSVYDSAVYHLQRSLLINKKDSLSRQTIQTYTNLGNVYSLSYDYKLAESYYQKALQHYQTTKNQEGIAKLYNNLGALFYEKGEDSISLHYFTKSIHLKEKLQDSSALVDSYLNIAELYSERNTKLAFEYLNKATGYMTEEKLATNLAKVHLSKASMYLEKDQLIKAKNELNQAMQLSEDINKHTVNRYFAKMQAEIAFKEGNFQEAYKHRIAYEKLNDAVFNEEKLWEIAAIQRSSQAKAKKAEVSLLEKDNALAEEKALRKQEENEKLYAFLIAFGVIVILVSIIAFYFYKLKKTTSQLAKQQELLLQERIQNLVNDQEIEIINATLTARTKEKEEISKELHNNIGSLLTSMNFHFQAFDQKLLSAHKNTKKLYDKTLQIIQAITYEIRNISHRFDQDPIPEFDLKTAITNFSEKVGNEQLKVHTTIHGLEHFQNSQISIFIFRILQELVNNTIKHAEATTLTIYITKNRDAINIMVEDDGKGFHEDQLANGIGLKNLRKDIHIMEGSCDIDSNPNRGTTINIDIPIRN
ncbi:tetratricopeptide repeat protein [uncultured Kordia sp.]|uniref:tetratricopeptide repeat-containing sensor histidine kinase n=1 Tax=uncultured Kordia sp. TaxID=507699 RepID=UPI00262BC7A0|nr:tetratricopeptide repeat protein [uncultured Kordia sp.]